MFDNHGMYDEDIMESAEQVEAGELLLSLEDPCRQQQHILRDVMKRRKNVVKHRATL